jgi:isoleucyl-tRNA synthetase
LVTSIILNSSPPYRQVLSHGFVVDENGHKMSKSLGNVLDPEEIIKTFGADVARFWVASSDFTKETRISFNLLKKINENYNKIRNTLRFLISVLSYSFSNVLTREDLEKELGLIDCYILFQLENLIRESEKKYEKYEFNYVCSGLLNFCYNELSSLYFEISKDSLYCDSSENIRRKQFITTFYYLF